MLQQQYCFWFLFQRIPSDVRLIIMACASPDCEMLQGIEEYKWGSYIAHSHRDPICNKREFYAANEPIKHFEGI